MKPMNNTDGIKIVQLFRLDDEMNDLVSGVSEHATGDNK